MREILFALLFAPALAAAQVVALTFDDGLDPRAQPDAAKWNAQMLRALDTAGAKAAYFPAGRFVDSPEGLLLAKAWGEAGHAIGNHTYSHWDLDAVELDAYLADIARGDAIFRALPGWRPRLRFPYLKEGATAAKRDGVRRWMEANGYEPAPVTIATSDWYYNQRLEARLRAEPQADTTRLGEAYVKHVRERAAYYDRLSRETLGRKPAHTMLLHANRLNAMFLPQVLATLKAEGWTFVDAGRALADPIYRERPNLLPAGNSLVSALVREGGAPVPPAPDDDHGKATLDALGY